MTEAEIRPAELLSERSPNFDKIRFMNSGTEAVMNAVKVARAYTGKPKIAKCENAYHGTFDTVQVSLGVEPTDLEAGDPVPQPGSLGTPKVWLTRSFRFVRVIQAAKGERNIPADLTAALYRIRDRPILPRQLTSTGFVT